MSKEKKQSRVDRWNESVAAAIQAANALESALGDLLDVQSEYQDWKDGLPENLESSAVGEKLEAVCDLDIEGAKDTVDDIISTLSDAGRCRSAARIWTRY